MSSHDVANVASDMLGKAGRKCCTHWKDVHADFHEFSSCMADSCAKKLRQRIVDLELINILFADPKLTPRYSVGLTTLSFSHTTAKLSNRQ